jgi:hypothetical protein
MASIAPIVIGCIDYLAYGTIFTRAMFLPKIKLDICREVVAQAAGGGVGRHRSQFYYDQKATFGEILVTLGSSVDFPLRTYSTTYP